MNFQLDTDTCSAHMRRPAKLAHRFIQLRGTTHDNTADFQNIPGLRLDDWLTP
jgi:predicted nucleic acid-binding protein